VLVAITGALAGLFHVLSGPDHLAAVAPLAASDRQRGWLAGWTWGIGHTAGVVVVSLAAAMLRHALPPLETVSAWGERLVGVALIGVGVWALRRSLRIERTPHAHGSIAHEHLHVQSGPSWIRRLGHAHASFYLGILHGVAGSSHFFGVLPALALPDRTAALLYLAAFGAGSIAAMTGFAAAVGAAGDRLHPGSMGHRFMMRTAAMVALVVGGWWLTIGA
jgi:hypothetical protein